MNYSRKKCLIALGWWALTCAAVPPLSFAPTQPRFAPATDEYRRI